MADSSSGSRANLKTALDRLQKTVTEQRQLIDKLRNENKQLKTDLQKAKTNSNNKPKPKPKPKPKASGGGVENGPSQAAAAGNLAALLGGRVKKKGKGKAKAGGVETGPSKDKAKGNLAALLGGRGKPKAASNGNNNNKPKAQTNGSSGGGGDAEMKRIFKKYEIMLKLGTGVQSAINRMVQDGIEKKYIAAFEKKHKQTTNTNKVTLEDIGLKKKNAIQIQYVSKMKRLHWEPIEPKYLLESIWENMDEHIVDYDVRKFELKFQVKERRKDAPNKPGKKPGQIVNNGEIKSFVSKKRSQQVLIGLKNLNKTNDEIRKALLFMNDKVMDPDTLAKLMDISPTSDEQTATEKNIITNGTGNPKHYGQVEQFFYCLYDFYNLNQRLKLWMFKQTFAEIQDSLLSQYKAVQTACLTIKSNKELIKLFTIVLAFGNHMNSGTRKGAAYGFNLKILSELSQIKSMDGTLSFLMFLYEFCDSKYPKIIDTMTNLTKLLKGAASMEMEVLKTAYSRIKDNMTQIKNLVTSDEIENYDIDDKFIPIMTKFHKKAVPLMKKFNLTVSNAVTSTKRVIKKFAFGTEEDPQSIEVLFKLLYNFCLDFEKARDKLIKREKERQKRILANKKNSSKNKNGKIPTNKKKPKGTWGSKVIPTKPPPGRRNGGNSNNFSNNNSNRNDDSKDDVKDDDNSGFSGKTLTKKLRQKMEFENKVSKHKRKLTLHIKDRSKFVKTGGTDATSQKNDTMRRISSMYQNDMSQINAIEDARKKAAMLRFNKFKLPELPGNRTSGKNAALMRPKFKTGILSDKDAGLVSNDNETYDPRKRKGTGTFIPDDQPIMAPPSKKRQNKMVNKSKLPQKPKNFNTNNLPNKSFPPPPSAQQPTSPSSPTSPYLTNNNSSKSKKDKKRKSKSGKTKKPLPPPPSTAPPSKGPPTKPNNMYTKKLPNKAPPMVNPHNAFVQQQQMGLNISNHNLAMANQMNPNNNKNLNFVGGKNNNPHYNNWLQQQNRYWQQQQQYWQQQQNLALNQFNMPGPNSKMFPNRR